MNKTFTIIISILLILLTAVVAVSADEPCWIWNEIEWLIDSDCDGIPDILEPIEDVTLDAQPNPAMVGEHVTLTCEVEEGYGPFHFEIRSGDGGIYETNTDNRVWSHGHEYDDADNYNARCIVTDSKPQTVSDTELVVVEEEPFDPLDVSLSGYPTSGVAPLDVNFECDATGGSGDYTYYWNFDNGNGYVLGGPDEPFEFVNEGNYDVRCKVVDGSEVEYSNYVYIDVEEEQDTLEVLLSGSPTSGYAPLDVAFECDATGGTEQYSYFWQFEEGQAYIAGSAEEEHEYDEEGTYRARCKVDDGQDVVTSNYVVIDVEEDEPVNEPPYFTENIPDQHIGCYATFDPVYFSQIVADDNPGDVLELDVERVSGNIDFTFNGATVYITNPHANRNGRLRFTVSDGELSLSQTADYSVTCDEPDPLDVSLSGSPTSGYAPLDVNFECQASGGSGNYDYYWNFDDGNGYISGSDDMQHEFEDAGEYNVRCKVDDGNEIEYSNYIEIDVDEEPQPEDPQFIYDLYDQRKSCHQSFTTINIEPMVDSGDYDFDELIFDVDYDDIYAYIDNDRLFIENPEENVEDEVTLILKDPSGVEKDRTTATYEVYGCQEPTDLTVDLDASPTSGEAPLYVEFTCDAQGGTGTYTYEWDFDEGHGFVTGPRNNQNTYNSEGNYHPRCRVHDGEDTVTSESVAIQVTDEPITLDVDLSGYPTRGTAPLDVSFECHASGGSGDYDYYWNFDQGAGYVSGSDDERHEFDEPGNYDVRCKVDDGDTVSYSNYVEITVNEQDPDDPYFRYDLDPQRKSCYQNFNPVNIEPMVDSGDYDFDELIFDVDYDDIYAYIDNDRLFIENPEENVVDTITIILKDPQGHEQDRTRATFEVYGCEDDPEDLRVDADGSPRSGEEPLRVRFTCDAQGGNYPYDYDWDFGDGKTSSTKNPTHIYERDGSYTATCTVEDEDGEIDSDSVSIRVYEEEEDEDDDDECSCRDFYRKIDTWDEYYRWFDRNMDHDCYYYYKRCRDLDYLDDYYDHYEGYYVDWLPYQPPIYDFEPQPAEPNTMCDSYDRVTHKTLPDFDCDSIPDDRDNCPVVPNLNQKDSNVNGIGDVCDLALTLFTITPQEVGAG
ncbi:MAG: PKD domain-containing protein, partial [Nanoarchaeota archaeon]|nr:PKD domain-containing protein [Nanoarchaeota archaeon]